MSNEETSTCESCGEEIWVNVCWCGDTIDNHGGYEGHSPVPMGCRCGYDRRGDACLEPDEEKQVLSDAEPTVRSIHRFRYKGSRKILD